LDTRIIGIAGTAIITVIAASRRLTC